MKYWKQMLGGACTALLMWGLVMVCDAIDELILNTSDGLAGGAFFIVPVLLFVIYLVHCIKAKPEGKQLFVWQICYALVFLPIWGYMYRAVNYGYYFVPQGKRSDFMDLNGIELMWYGFSALCAFLLFCILFHSIRLIVRKCRHQDV